MQKLKNVSISLSRVLILCLIVAVFTAGIVYSTSPTQPFTINRGVYPGAPSFTVWAEGDSCFAKNQYGVLVYSATGGDAASLVGTQALANGGKVLFFGDITVDSPIMVPSNSEIEIQGTITLAAGSNCAIFKNANWDNELPYSGVDTNIFIHGGVLDGNKANNPTDAPEHGIIGFLHALNVRIEGVHIINVRSWAAIYLCGWGPTQPGGMAESKSWIINNLIEGTVGGGPYGYAIGISAYPTNDIIIQGNQLYNNQGGIMLEDEGGQETIIDGNIIIGTTVGYGIWGGASYLTVTNNFINDTAGYGIIVSRTHEGFNSHGIVANNRVYHSGLIGIQVFYDYATITGNEVLYSEQSGIYVNGKYYSITGNIACNNTNHGIWVDYTYNSTVVGNNANFNEMKGISTTNGADYNIIVGNIAVSNGDGTVDIDYSGTHNKVAYNIGRYTPQGAA